MQVLILTMGMMLFSPPSPAAEPSPAKWEICLDKGDFDFSVEGTLQEASTSTAKKEGCKFTFSVSGGKGEKWIFNVCDPSIHIDAYATFDTTDPKRLYAGSAGCPSPLFGADFDTQEKEIGEYRRSREKIFDILAKVKKEYGEGMDKVNLSDPNSFRIDKSEGRVACGQLLISEYLRKCLPFEEKRPEAVKGALGTLKSHIPGIHDQTITK